MTKFKLRVVGMSIGILLFAGCRTEPQVNTSAQAEVTALLKLKSQMSVGASLDEFQLSLAAAEATFEQAGKQNTSKAAQDALEAYANLNDLWKAELQYYAPYCSESWQSGTSRCQTIVKDECTLHPDYSDGTHTSCDSATLSFDDMIQFFSDRGENNASLANAALNESN